jgi:hypothetical protein
MVGELAAWPDLVEAHCTGTYQSLSRAKPALSMLCSSAIAVFQYVDNKYFNNFELRINPYPSSSSSKIGPQYHLGFAKVRFSRPPLCLPGKKPVRERESEFP